jgi:hypothetical protein
MDPVAWLALGVSTSVRALDLRARRVFAVREFAWFARRATCKGVIG